MKQNRVFATKDTKGTKMHREPQEACFAAPGLLGGG
jgi:hypothetical protein